MKWETLMKIAILGTGCPKCKKLSANAAAAVAELELDCEIEKVTDINDIMMYGVMMTPALAVNGKVQSAGKVMSVAEIKEVLAGGCNA
jgi:small redox-active disulfide protein 2